MRALVWHGKSDVRVDTVDDPRIEEPTDAIVRVTASGLCGSDLHLYKGVVVGLKEGDILGHEPMGVVEEVGPEVTQIKPGDRVVVPFNIACGHCFQCLRGMQSQCETTQNPAFRKGASLFGYTHMYGGVAGGQAEYLRVPQAHYGPVVVPEQAPEQAWLLLSDVLPTAWQAVAYADVPAGGTVAVFGLGPIGQMCARIAKAQGAGRVIGVDLVPERLEMARRRGVEIVDLTSVDDPDEAVLDLTAGRGADSVIDAVGMEATGSLPDRILQALKIQPDRLSALHAALGSVRRGGTVSVTGVYVGPMQMWPLGDLFDKQVTVRWGQANCRRWIHEIVPLLTPEDPLGCADLVTHEVPLEGAPDAYEMFQEKRDGAVKVVFRP